MRRETEENLGKLGLILAGYEVCSEFSVGFSDLHSENGRVLSPSVPSAGYRGGIPERNSLPFQSYVWILLGLLVTVNQSLIVGGVGALAGFVGGLAGVGGSMVILPALALVFQFTEPDRPEQHVFAAAAMIINVLVAIPATWRHWRAGVYRPDLLRWLLPTMAVSIVAGVLISNRVDGRVLQQVLAAMIAWDSLVNLYRLVRRVDESTLGPERVGAPVMMTAGITAGLAGGIAGLGGGGLIVPILQVAGRVKLREAIATSAMTMCVSSLIGATLKLGTMHSRGVAASDAVRLAALMAPGAIVFSMLGATLTHRLPIGVLRLVVSIILLLLAAKLAFG